MFTHEFGFNAFLVVFYTIKFKFMFTFFYYSTNFCCLQIYFYANLSFIHLKSNSHVNIFRQTKAIINFWTLLRCHNFNSFPYNVPATA